MFNIGKMAKVADRWREFNKYFTLVEDHNSYVVIPKKSVKVLHQEDLVTFLSESGDRLTIKFKHEED